MPLLRRQVFERTDPPDDLKPDEEVFHCKLTNEIFRDYEAFFERIILCNSLVWSCAITGKTGLTYQEALECEEKAWKSLGAFPEPLRKPILCIASLTNRTRLNDMNEEVYSFAKDRYFIRELLEVVHRNQKRTARVIKVMVPKNDNPEVSSDDDDIIILDKPKQKIPDIVDLTMSDSSEGSDGKSKPSTASNSKESLKSPLKSPSKSRKLLPPELYNYMVQFIDRKETVTVRADQCNRKKGSYSRDKCKLFLKQHCEPGEGLWRVKARFVNKFKLDQGTFDEVYAGPRPTFLVAVIKKRPAGSVEKKPKKTAAAQKEDSAKKAKKQLDDLEESEIQKRLQKKQLTPQQKAKLLEQLRVEKQSQKNRERFERMKAALEMKVQKKNEKEAERLRRIEEQRIRAEYLAEWSKTRDDLACDDLKPLPEPIPVRTHIPADSFGDALMLVEFFRTFESIVDISDVFPDGVRIALIEKVVTGKDVDGPLFDMVKVLLTTIFELQEEENIEEEEMVKELKTMSEPEKMSDVSLDYLIKTATKAAQIPFECHGTALAHLTLDPYTMTEIVRLHLLSSGARANVMNAKFRYQERGGYTSLDDPGLELRRREPGLLEQLSGTNLFDLDPAEKMKILVTLTHQVMSYAAARDIVEDYADQLRCARADLRQLQLRDMKYDREDQQIKWKRRCEDKAKELERVQALAVQKQKEKEDKLAGKTAEEGTGKEKEPSQPTTPNDDSRTSSRLKAQTQIKEEEEIQKKLDKATGKNPSLILTYSEEGLTPAQIRHLDDKKMEYRASKREEGKLEQEELHEAIAILQQSVAIYPLGRDRMFRRYWLFAGTDGFFVEDQEEFVPDGYVKPVRQNLTLNPHIVENIPQNAVHNLQTLNQAMLTPSRGGHQATLGGHQATLVQRTSGSQTTQIVRVSSSQCSPLSGTSLKFVQSQLGSPGSIKIVQGSPKSPVKLMPGSPVKLMSGSPVKLMPGSPVKLMPGSPVKLMPGSPVKLLQGQRSPVKIVQAVSSSGVQFPTTTTSITSIQLGSTVKLLPTIGGVAVGPAITGTVTNASGMKFATSSSVSGSPTTTTTISVVKGSPTSDKENVTVVNGANVKSPTLGSPIRMAGVGASGSPVSVVSSSRPPVLNGSGTSSGTSPVKIITLSPTKTFNTAPRLMSPNSSRSLLNSPQPCPAVDQILTAKRVRWAYYDSIEAIDRLIESLNTRGHREKELRNVLTEQKEVIRKQIEKCDTNLLRTKSETEEEEAEQTQMSKTVALPQNYRKLKSQGIVKDDSAQEQMELTLREMLLDMEERIFFGSLGSMKIQDRLAWREAIEQGSYVSQNEPEWPGKIGVKVEKMETDDDANESSQAVRDLCMGLLQVEQGVERRYLNRPLGETEKERKAKQRAAIVASKKEERHTRANNKKDEEEENGKEDAASLSEPAQKEVTLLERWEESLMSSSSLCQIYLHMATLESSVMWSKSALHARCRLCRRKGDAEQMLLCDMCDRGHHMYCLKPKVTKVPQGDWYCPECRPKDVQRTPRKKSRRRYEEEEEAVEEEGETEESQETEDSDDEAGSDEAEDEDEDEEGSQEETEGETDDESTEVVSEEEDEPEPMAPKIKMRTNKKTQPVAAPSKSSRKSTPVQQSSKTTKRGKVTPTPPTSTGRRSSRGVNDSMEEVKKGRGARAETPPTGRNNKRKSMDVNGSVDGEGLAAKNKRLSDGSKVATASSSRGNTESFTKLRKLEDLVQEMIRMDDAWPFLKPVTKKEAPDYHEVVKTPVDFSKIRMRMNDHRYADAAQLVADIRLMFSNCERYNLPSADPAKAGVRLSKLFEKKIKEMKLLSDTTTGRRTSRKN